MNRVSNLESGLFQKEKLECLELSPREMQIARLLAWGYTQKEIAGKLNISPLTVTGHLKNIYRELGIHKETDLTRWYLFKEYCIDDNPFKKVLAILFLILSFTMIMDDKNMVRVFRCRGTRAPIAAARPVREKRFRNVFELQLVTA
jgi:DNA-binding CsgD family transcriptional regulator